LERELRTGRSKFNQKLSQWENREENSNGKNLGAGATTDVGVAYLGTPPCGGGLKKKKEMGGADLWGNPTTHKKKQTFKKEPQLYGKEK